MNAADYKWSFFIAHAGADQEQAEALYERLAAHAPTFLDSRCIELGDDWDRELARAQEDSLISVVLVSANSGAAYYEREEIAAAIAMARADDKRHRVVPVFLDEEAAQMEGLYGLRLKHSLQLGHGFGIDEAAQALLGLLQRLQQPAAATTAPQAPRLPPLRRRRTMQWAGAGALLAVVLGGLWWWLGPELQQSSPGAPATGVPQTPVAAVAGEHCVEVDYFSPNVIPHYLLNSIGSENFPYWLKIVARNRCGDDRILTLRFERSDNVALENPPQSQEFTVHGSQTVERTFKPLFDLATQQPDSLAIHWSIEDENRTKLSADSIRTEIVPPLTVAWDLQKPAAPGARVPVDREYLLGSLKAWILTPPPKVSALGRACRTTPASGVLLEREEAIRACYRHLFTGSRAVLVSDSPMIGFPTGMRQRIRPHLQLIEDRSYKASSLEAALLFTTVVEAQHKDGVDLDPVLLVAPLDGAADANLKTALVAWREAGRPWRAIDLRLANALTFEANVAAASARMAAIVADDPAITEAIEVKGAGFSKEGKVAALNFAKVPPEYRIRALP